MLNERAAFRRAQVGIMDQGLRSEVHACMRAQGTLTALITSLTVPATHLSMQIGIFESVCKLIYASPLAQNEFADLDGYMALEQVVACMGRADTVEYAGALDTVLSLVKALVLDVRGSGLVGNMDAFAMLVRLCVSEVPFRPSFHQLLESLLSGNTLNIAALFAVDAFSILVDAATDGGSGQLLYQYAAVLGAQMPIKYVLSPLVRAIAGARPRF